MPFLAYSMTVSCLLHPHTDIQSTSTASVGVGYRRVAAPLSWYPDHPTIIWSVRELILVCLIHRHSSSLAYMTYMTYIYIYISQGKVSSTEYILLFASTQLSGSATKGEFVTIRTVGDTTKISNSNQPYQLNSDGMPRVCVCVCVWCVYVGDDHSFMEKREGDGVSD